MNLGNSNIYGVDGYSVYPMTRNIFTASSVSNIRDWLNLYWQDTVFLVNDLVKKYFKKNSEGHYTLDDITLDINHPELLKTAKTLYIHPKSSIPRGLVTQKYKKVLNPWLADAVILPNRSIPHIYTSQYIVFVNEDKKQMFYMHPYWFNRNTANDTLQSVKVGTKAGTMLPFTEDAWLNAQPDDDYTDLMKAFIDSEVDFNGEGLYIKKKDEWFYDMLSGSLPTSKCVYDNEVIAALGDDDNQPTVESYTSIREMLESKDSDTQTAGLKALSMMDYMSYPNSTMFLFFNLGSEWRYCKGASASATRFMFQQLFYGTPSYYPCFSDKFITSKDYELLKALIPKVYKDMGKELINNEIERFPFMYAGEELELRPRIKD